jgi:adenosylcobinamide-GDP ribazoletransferase
MFIPFLAALQFLTLVPPLVQRPFTAGELGRAVGYYPLVGLLIGVILAAANYALGLFLPSQVRAALVLTLWVLLSGALHLDGLLDACDGILGGFTPDKRLEIMRDERVGAFGLAGGFLLLLLKFTTLGVLSNSAAALLLIPTLSRWGMSLALFCFPYAREKGLGRDIKDHTTWRQVLLASLITIAMAWFSTQWLGLLALLVAGLTTWAVAAFVLRRIPGLTGDIYGAINELIEVVLLVMLVSPVSL